MEILKFDNAEDEAKWLKERFSLMMAEMDAEKKEIEKIRQGAEKIVLENRNLKAWLENYAEKQSSSSSDTNNNSARKPTPNFGVSDMKDVKKPSTF